MIFHTVSAKDGSKNTLDLEDEERPSQPQKDKDEELEELLEKNPCRAQSELAEALGMTRQTIFKCKKRNFPQKTEN